MTPDPTPLPPPNPGPMPDPTPIPPSPMPPPPNPLPPPPPPPPPVPMSPCDMQKNQLASQLHDTVMLEYKAWNKLFDLRFNVTANIRRNMNLIAELDSPCEVNFGRIETAIYNAYQTCNTNLVNLNHSNLETDLGNVNCSTDPNATNTLNGLGAMISNANSLAWTDATAAGDLKARLQTYIDSICFDPPATYPRPTFDSTIWG